MSKERWFKVTDNTLDALRKGGVPEIAVARLHIFNDGEFYPESMILEECSETAPKPGQQAIPPAYCVGGAAAAAAQMAPESGQKAILLDKRGQKQVSAILMQQPKTDRTNGMDMSANAIGGRLHETYDKNVRGAQVAAFGAPPIDGLGTTGGFKLIVEDRANLGLDQLESVSNAIVDRAKKDKSLTGLYNSSGADTPWLYLDIDRTACMTYGVQVSDVFTALQAYLGSYYVNNFNLFGRTWQVNIQADPKFRDNVEDIKQVQVRNSAGQMVRLGTMLEVRDTGGPVMILRYNMYTAAAITGDAGPGTSSGQAVERIEEAARKELPRSMEVEWTDLAYLQNQAGNTAMWFFALAVIFVFLVLAAQYESWKLPLAVILVVPMCLFCSVVGLQIAHMEVNIFTQIGFVVLVGLASKNAILIVEFAKQQQEIGVPRWQATLEACRLRLRPILMTSFAFILGVLPLVISHGAGAEMRRALGLAVFSGMLGVTFFGVFLTPVFYYVIQGFGDPPKIGGEHPDKPDLPHLEPTPPTAMAAKTGVQTETLHRSHAAE